MALWVQVMLLSGLLAIGVPGSADPAEQNLQHQVLALQDLVGRLVGRLQVLEDEVRGFKHLYVSTVPRKTVAHHGDRTTGASNCYLGTEFLFNEYVGYYGEGIPLQLNDQGSQYECLYQCLLNASCVAVSMSATESDSFNCLGLSEETGQIQLPDWNYYRLQDRNKCVVGNPEIAFQATFTGVDSYLTDQTILWNVLRGNTTTDLKSDGSFHIAVSGLYEFSLSMRPGCVCDSKLDLYVAGVYSGTVHPQDFGDSASGVFVVDCSAGDKVHVQSGYDSTFIGGDGYETSFSGRLMYMH